MAEQRGEGPLGRALAALHKTASYSILGIMAWIVADVAGRVFLNRPLPGTAEIVAYSLPVITFLQIPHVLRAGHHLRSPIFDGHVSGRTRGVLAIVACALGAALFVLAAYSIWRPMLSAWQGGQYFGEGVRIPAGPAWSAIFVGCVLMVAQFLVGLAGSVRVALRPPSSQPIR